MSKPTINADAIAHWLCQENNPFSWRQNFFCVPNVSHGFLPWEADLLVCTKSGYLDEVEIKISMSDWKSDAKKKKFIYKDDPGMHFTAQAKSWSRIRHFWYAAPMKLAARFEEAGIPDWVGVMGIDAEAAKQWDQYKCFKEPSTNREARKLDLSEKMHLARLGTIRLWTAPQAALAKLKEDK